MHTTQHLILEIVSSSFLGEMQIIKKFMLLAAGAALQTQHSNLKNLQNNLKLKTMMAGIVRGLLSFGCWLLQLLSLLCGLDLKSTGLGLHRPELFANPIRKRIGVSFIYYYLFFRKYNS